ncbi:leucine rich repeat [Seminavis robusta]|uniref:Leucine rich repeat n=1 Tax=Seminavis robusta TaxID=568900 RepID=A0A9N8DLT1_9STRA|nr:leucine rich repeat [Seminavis robusta]|eukprot:Sro126_g060470.1 leucine rich repeat (447) ;mRNA; r:17926-19266
MSEHSEFEQEGTLGATEDYQKHIQILKAEEKSKRRRYGFLIILVSILAICLPLILVLTTRNKDNGDGSQSGGTVTATTRDTPNASQASSSGNGNDNNNPFSVGDFTVVNSSSFTINTNTFPSKEHLKTILEMQFPEAFKDPFSYQNKAVDWLLKHANTSTPSSRTILQRYALACLYFATNGVANAHTTRFFGYVISAPAWVVETDWIANNNECTWYGINCTADGLVSKLSMRRNRMTGSLPTELALLGESLQELDLYGNYFHNVGEEGHAWLDGMKQLKVLVLGNTLLEHNNGIPLVFGQLTNLRDFDCSNVLYRGPLRGDVFANLSQLEWLNIDDNQFGGPLPQELIQLPTLELLHANNASIVGDISFVRDLPGLKILWVDDNPGLTGDAAALEDVTTLASLSVKGTNIYGSIPSFLCHGDSGQIYFDCSAQLCGCDCTCSHNWR